ncbi:hypothetical protein ACTQX2_06585 [Megamonas funiformis]|uniref:hypothetical protein n=1 Tax=Megamonas funiformis TaxID=437897 RepID=UPI003F9E49A0
MSKEFIEITNDNDSKVLINLNDIKEIKIEDTDYTNINEAQLIAIRNNGEKIILDEGDYAEMKSSYYYLYDLINVIEL